MSRGNAWLWFKIIQIFCYGHGYSLASNNIAFWQKFELETLFSKVNKQAGGVSIFFLANETFFCFPWMSGMIYRSYSFFLNIQSNP